jgi:hypothetical protein
MFVTVSRKTTNTINLVALLASSANAFHDCVEAAASKRARFATADACSGGLCLGMHDGPHEGGPASYPVAWGADGFGTSLNSTMTVRHRERELSARAVQFSRRCPRTRPPSTASRTTCGPTCSSATRATAG